MAKKSKAPTAKQPKSGASSAKSPKGKPIGLTDDLEFDDIRCVDNGTGMADLSFNLRVQHTTEQSVDSIEIILDGFMSAILPNEKANSPTTSGNTVTHVYTCSGMVMCGPHNLVARVVLNQKVTQQNGFSVQCCQ